MATESENPPPSPERPLKPREEQEFVWCDVQRTQLRQSLLGSATTAWPILNSEEAGADFIVPQNSWPRVTGRTSFVMGCGFDAGMDVGPFLSSSF